MYINVTFDDEGKFGREYNAYCDLCDMAEALQEEADKLSHIVESCTAVSDAEWESADDAFTRIAWLLRCEYLTPDRLEMAQETYDELCDLFSWIA